MILEIDNIRIIRGQQSLAMTESMDQEDNQPSTTANQNAFFDDGLASIDKYMKAIDDFAKLTLTDIKSLFNSNFTQGGQFKDCLPSLRADLGNLVCKKLFNGCVFKLVKYNCNTVIEHIHHLTLSYVNNSLSTKALKIFNFKNDLGINDSSSCKGNDDITSVLSNVMHELETLKISMQRLENSQSSGINNGSSHGLERPNSLISNSVNHKKRSAEEDISPSVVHKTPKVAKNANTDDNGWTQVVNKNKKPIDKPNKSGNYNGYKKKRKVITGSSDSNELAGVPKKRYYRISKINNSFDIDAVKKHVKTFVNGETVNIEVEDISNSKYNFYKMYKVTIDSTHAEAMENPNNWPSHVEVSRFYFFNRKSKVDAAEAGIAHSK